MHTTLPGGALFLIEVAFRRKLTASVIRVCASCQLDQILLVEKLIVLYLQLVSSEVQIRMYIIYKPNIANADDFFV